MSTATGTQSQTRRPLAQRGLLAIVLSAIANAVLLAVALALDVAPGFDPLSWGSVLLFTVLGAVGAVVVYWLLGRFSANRDRTFTIVALVVLVLSFVPDLALLSADENATVLGVVVLMVMHVVVAAICIAVLARRWSPV